MAVSDQEFARIREKVLRLERGGVGGGISSVNFLISGSGDDLAGDTFRLSGSNGTILSSSIDGNVIGITASLNAEIPLASQTYTNISNVYTVAGGTSINAADYTGNSYFKVAGYADGNAKLEIVLYNLTDSAVVQTIGITSSVSTASINSVATLTGDKFYEARIKRVDGTSNDYVYLLNASIKLTS